MHILTMDKFIFKRSKQIRSYSEQELITSQTNSYITEKEGKNPN